MSKTKKNLSRKSKNKNSSRKKYGGVLLPAAAPAAAPAAVPVKLTDVKPEMLDQEMTTLPEEMATQMEAEEQANTQLVAAAVNEAESGAEDKEDNFDNIIPDKSFPTLDAKKNKIIESLNAKKNEMIRMVTILHKKKKYIRTFDH